MLAGVKRSACRLRLPATMAYGRTSDLRSGKATSELQASTCTLGAMTARSQQLRPLTRPSCCATSTAETQITLSPLSPTSHQSTTRYGLVHEASKLFCLCTDLYRSRVPALQSDDLALSCYGLPQDALTHVADAFAMCVQRACLSP